MGEVKAANYLPAQPQSDGAPRGWAFVLQPQLEESPACPPDGTESGFAAHTCANVIRTIFQSALSRNSWKGPACWHFSRLFCGSVLVMRLVIRGAKVFVMGNWARRDSSWQHRPAEAFGRARGVRGGRCHRFGATYSGPGVFWGNHVSTCYLTPWFKGEE